MLRWHLTIFNKMKWFSQKKYGEFFQQRVDHQLLNWHLNHEVFLYKA